MDGQIRLWNVANSTQILAWQAHSDWIRCVAFSPDGKLIASCGNDRTVRIWDSESAKCLKIFRGHTDWVWSVYFVWGKRLVVSASSDRTARIWSLDLGLCVDNQKLKPLVSGNSRGSVSTKYRKTHEKMTISIVANFASVGNISTLTNITDAQQAFDTTQRKI